MRFLRRFSFLTTLVLSLARAAHAIPICEATETKVESPENTYLIQWKMTDATEAFMSTSSTKPDISIPVNGSSMVTVDCADAYGGLLQLWAGGPGGSSCNVSFNHLATSCGSAYPPAPSCDSEAPPLVDAHVAMTGPTAIFNWAVTGDLYTTARLFVYDVGKTIPDILSTDRESPPEGLHVNVGHYRTYSLVAENCRGQNGQSFGLGLTTLSDLGAPGVRNLTVSPDPTGSPAFQNLEQSTTVRQTKPIIGLKRAGPANNWFYKLQTNPK